MKQVLIGTPAVDRVCVISAPPVGDKQRCYASSTWVRPSDTSRDISGFSPSSASQLTAVNCASCSRQQEVGSNIHCGISRLRTSSVCSSLQCHTATLLLRERHQSRH